MFAVISALVGAASAATSTYQLTFYSDATCGTATKSVDFAPGACNKNPTDAAVTPTSSLAVFNVGGAAQLSFFTDYTCSAGGEDFATEFGACTESTIASGTLRVYYKITQEAYWSDGATYVKVSEYGECAHPLCRRALCATRGGARPLGAARSRGVTRHTLPLPPSPLASPPPAAAALRRCTHIVQLPPSLSSLFVRAAVAGTCTGTALRTSYVPAIPMPGADVAAIGNAQFCDDATAGTAVACAGTSAYKFVVSASCISNPTATANPSALSNPTTCHGDAASKIKYECISKGSVSPGSILTPTMKPTVAPTAPSGAQPWQIGLGISLALFAGVLGIVCVLIVTSIVLKYTVKIPSNIVLKGEEKFDPSTDQLVWTDSVETIGGVPTKESEQYRELAAKAAADGETGDTTNFKLVVTKTHGEKPFCDFPACAESDSDDDE